MVTVKLDFNPMQVLGMVNPHQHFILSEFVFIAILCAYFQHICQYLYRNCCFTTLSSIFFTYFQHFTAYCILPHKPNAAIWAHRVLHVCQLFTLQYTYELIST